MIKSLTDFFKGDTKAVQFTVKINGVPKDITLDTVTFFLYNNETDSDAEAIIDKDCIPSDPTNGITNLVLLSTDTDITRKEYYYKVKVFNNASEPSTVMADTIRCK